MRKQAELAVHKRKVEDVRQWLLEAFDGGPSAKLRKYRVSDLWSWPCFFLIVLVYFLCS